MKKKKKKKQVGNPKVSHRYTVQCVLPINLFNQQIFTFIWFWYNIVLLINVYSLVVWTYRFMPSKRLRYITRRIEIMRQALFWRNKNPLNFEQSNDLQMHEFEKDLIRHFVHDYLESDGLFILRVLSANTSDFVCTELIQELWKYYRKQRKFNRSDDDDDDDDDDNDNDNDNDNENDENEDVNGQDAEGQTKGQGQGQGQGQTRVKIQRQLHKQKMHMHAQQRLTHRNSNPPPISTPTSRTQNQNQNQSQVQKQTWVRVSYSILPNITIIKVEQSQNEKILRFLINSIFHIPYYILHIPLFLSLFFFFSLKQKTTN